MALARPILLTHPWKFWTLLTYGFAHDPTNIMHVGGNMFVLWVFGPDVERLCGREKFMRLYLSLIVSSGLAWFAIQQISRTNIGVIGASGAIMGIMAIYILNYPHRTFLFYFVIPVPAWLLGIVYRRLGLLGSGFAEPAATIRHTPRISRGRCLDCCTCALAGVWDHFFRPGGRNGRNSAVRRCEFTRKTTSLARSAKSKCGSTRSWKKSAAKAKRA